MNQVQFYEQEIQKNKDLMQIELEKAKDIEV